MRSSIILSTILASTALVLAAPQAGSSSGGNSGNVTCGDTCHTIIDKGCAENDTLCKCKSDFNIQIPFWKCLYDGCPLEAASLGVGFYTVACNEAAANVTTASKTSTSEAAIPTGAIAKAFTVPSCATKCVSKETIPRCEKGNPACVCGEEKGNSAASDDSDDEGAKMNKCIVDSCSTQDAAVAFTTLLVDCGVTTKDFPANQLPFPYNGFALATASGSGSASSSGNSTTGNSTNGGNSTGGQPVKPEGAAMTNGMSILAMAAAAFMGVALL